MLIASVIFNIVLLIILIFCVAQISYKYGELVIYQEQWSIWEARFYEAQRIVRDTYDKHLQVDGIRSKMNLTDFRK